MNVTAASAGPYTKKNPVILLNLIGYPNYLYVMQVNRAG